MKQELELDDRGYVVIAKGSIKWIDYISSITTLIFMIIVSILTLVISILIISKVLGVI